MAKLANEDLLLDAVLKHVHDDSLEERGVVVKVIGQQELILEKLPDCL
jgi:hypothetical protein